MARIRVRVQPGASKNEILGFVDDMLRIKLMAPPVEGKANEALIALLARALQVRKSDVEIVRGTTGREKLVAVDGLGDEEIRQRLKVSSSPDRS